MGGASCGEKDDVKYSGPVVYTNLPPPLLYFPSFPQTISNRGDGQEGKRIEYVPFPYKDLPLLVYQSDQQPPVHVVEKGKEDEDQYQTYQNDEEAPAEDPQPADKTSADQGDPQGHQFISIGLSSIQTDGQHGQGNVQYGPQYGPAHQVRFAPQNPGPTGPAYTFFHAQPPHQTEQTQQMVPVEPSRQVVQNYAEGGENEQPTVGETPTQHVGITIIHQPEGGSQASDQQHARPDNQQLFDDNQQFVSIGLFPIHIPGGDPKQLYNVMAPVQSNQGGANVRQSYQYSKGGANVQQSYQYPAGGANVQQSYQYPGGDANAQQSYQYAEGGVNAQQSSEYPEDGANVQQSYQYSEGGVNVQQSYQYPEGEANVQQSYHDAKDYDQGNQQQGDVYSTSDQSYQNGKYNQPKQQQFASNGKDYRMMMMMMNSQNPRGTEELRQNLPKPPAGGSNAPTGYQVISIDLSTLTNQNAPPPRNVNPGYRQQPEPLKKPVQQENEMENPRGKEYQQILIQIPNNMAEQANMRGMGPKVAAYTGTAQSGSKERKPQMPSRRPVYNKPAQRRPPQKNYQQEKPRSVQGQSQNGLLGNGINIAIIKQADASGQYPAFRPPPGGPNVRFPSQPSPNNHMGRPRSLVRPSPQSHPGQRGVSAGRPQSVASQSVRNIRHNIPQGTKYQEQRVQASSNLLYTAVLPDGFGPHQTAGKRLPRPSVQSNTHKSYDKLPGASGTNLDGVSFDDINAFLSPSYDLFGDNKKGAAKDNVKFLQAIAGDIMEPPHFPQPFATHRPAPIIPSPFPYRYWEQTVYGPGHYSHMQHPHVRGGKPLPVRGYQGLKSKLSALIRGKSEISPRREGVEFDGVDLAGFIAKNLGDVFPMSGTHKPSLDGISIPLRSSPTSRVSDDEDEGGPMKPPLPPIIVYKGFKPPVEIYGSKEDIEKDNKTEKAAQKSKEPHPVKKTEEPQQAKKPEKVHSGQAMSERRTGYLDYMYSMLPELLIGSLGGRYESDRNQWLPVSPIEYSDAYDRNETTTLKPDPSLSPAPSYNWSAKGEASLKEDIEELFSLLGREEKTIRD